MKLEAFVFLSMRSSLIYIVYDKYTDGIKEALRVREHLVGT